MLKVLFQKEPFINSLVLKKLIRFVVTIAILLFLVYILRNKISELRQYDYKVNGFYLIASFFALLAATVALHANWYFITKALGCNLGLINSVTVRIKSEIGKYIPGRVLGYGYLIVYYNKEGKNQLRVLSSSIYELYLSTVSSFLFFTFIHIFTSFTFLDSFRPVFIVFSIIGIVLLHPVFFQKMSDILCMIFRREKITYKISFLNALGILLLYLQYWILFSLAFFLFAKAFTDVKIVNILFLSGSFAISSFAGFMAFFMPAGLGAREGVLIYLLGILTGNIMAIVISISSRIWIILGDIILFFAAMTTDYFVKRNAIK